jgi:hypothetical protein
MGIIGPRVQRKWGLIWNWQYKQYCQRLIAIWASQYELALKRGDRQRVCEIAIDYTLMPTCSWPVNVSSFLERDARVQPVLDWLVSSGIDIRVTQPNALMGTLGRYGCYITDGKRQLILIDPERKCIEDPSELIDTLFHEAIHATGPFLNRNRLPIYPEDGILYHEEEFIATAGAAYLGDLLGIKDVSAKGLSTETWAAYLAVMLDCSPSSAEVDSIIRNAIPKIRCAVDFILRRESSVSLCLTNPPVSVPRDIAIQQDDFI